jgi:formylglycine-generating enzyme required for sulfatase activity
MKSYTLEIRGVQNQMIYCPDGHFWTGLDEALYDQVPASYLIAASKRKEMTMKGFWIGEVVVTEAFWNAVMFDHFIPIESQNLPKMGLNWYDWAVFCNRLSELEGLEPCFTLTNVIFSSSNLNSIHWADVHWNEFANGYRLPTEAEWEYAAKAGTTYLFSGSNEIDEVGWYYDNARKLKPVKLKKPNDWGLYDMSGNIQEWCFDQSEQNIQSMMAKVPQYKRKRMNFTNIKLESYDRVVKGGFFLADQYSCSIAYQLDVMMNFLYHIGLRLVRSEWGALK